VDPVLLRAAIMRFLLQALADTACFL